MKSLPSVQFEKYRYLKSVIFSSKKTEEEVKWALCVKEACNAQGKLSHQRADKLPAPERGRERPLLFISTHCVQTQQHRSKENYGKSQLKLIISILLLLYFTLHESIFSTPSTWEKTHKVRHFTKTRFVAFASYAILQTSPCRFRAGISGKHAYKAGE